MSQWYLSQEGRAAGPYGSEKIIAKIKAGELTQLDLIFQVGAKEWMALSQVAEFASYFKSGASSSQGPKQSQDWVLLKKISGEEGSQFEQLGPYAQQEVLQLIEKGEIKFTDFAWKAGMENWQRLGELDVFSEPLPSTPAVDSSLYESTKTDVNVAPMSKMVRIEHYQADEDVSQPEKTDKTQVSVRTAPINNQDFVTQSEITAAAEASALDGTPAVDTSDNESTSFWSLEPPEEEKTQVKGGLKKGKKAPEKRKRKKSQLSSKKTSPWLAKEQLQLVVALVALGLAFIFFYQSFRVDRGEAMGGQEVMNEAGSPPESSMKGSRSSQDMKAQAQKMNKMVAEMKREVEDAESSQLMKTPAQLSSSSPQKSSGLARRRLNKKQSAANPPISKSLPKPTKKRQVGRASIPKSRGSRKQLQVPPSKNRKALNKVTRSSVKKHAAASGANGPPLKGSSKQQSFYKQRDRKALFYSSLRAETLAVEIETQYRKLKSNKAAWKRYYAQWRKKVASALASDLQNYPLPSETYAYPKLLSAFKKDYALFYDYGESFNGKVRGARQVASPPKNMKAVFAKYRKKARSLGQ